MFFIVFYLLLLLLSVIVVVCWNKTQLCGFVFNTCLCAAGRSYSVFSQRMLNQCLESLVQKIQSGVVINFEKTGPDPPPLEGKRRLCLASVKCVYWSDVFWYLQLGLLMPKSSFLFLSAVFIFSLLWLTILLNKCLSLIFPCYPICNRSILHCLSFPPLCPSGWRLFLSCLMARRRSSRGAEVWNTAVALLSQTDLCTAQSQNRRSHRALAHSWGLLAGPELPNTGRK